MAVSIVIPEMGESVKTGVVSRWIKANGDVVRRDEPVMELETDKISLEVLAPADGKLSHSAKEGDTVNVGGVVGSVDESVPVGAGAGVEKKASGGVAVASNGTHAAEAVGVGGGGGGAVRATPLAKKTAEVLGVDLARVPASGASGKVKEADVVAFAGGGSGGRAGAGSAAGGGLGANKAGDVLPGARAVGAVVSGGSRGVRREKLSSLRQKLAARLVEAQHNAAMLTTFNECDMTAVMELRKRYKEDFEKRHGVGLGFMSFFVKAAAHALMAYPAVNSSLVMGGGGGGGPEIEFHDYADIALAVSTPKGLTVPVLRSCESLTFAGIEAGVKELAGRARDNKLTLDDLTGGTFTITNGGIFGSLMSTPILNPPQTAILGMHAIKNRAVEDPDKAGAVAIRPMMYLALSYDHRVIDGSEAVQFLVAIKSAIEKPERLMLGL